MPQDRLRSPRGGHGRRTTSLSDFEFRVWDQYQLSADDFGVMRLSAITVQADNDNLADRPSTDVQAALERLVSVELVASFEHQGRAYICQLDWQTFQKVEYPRATGLPKPTDDLLTRCDAATRRLFAKHPGGWKKQKGRKRPGTASDESPEQHRNGSGTPSEEAPERSPEQIPKIPHKPLAVSSSNSRQHEQEPAPAALSRRAAGQPPLNLGLRRLKVWRWMLDDLIAALGDHADAFDLEAWLQALDAREKNVVPDVWPWLKTELIAEVRRRGLPMVETSDRKPLFTQTEQQMGEAVLAKLRGESGGVPR